MDLKLLSALVLVASTLAILGVLNYRWEFLKRILLASLRWSGDCPEHVAIIMDGNRRWAKSRDLAPQEGHRSGGDTMVRTLNWCKEAGINAITVYAFSIENFKRPAEEVDTIMDLALTNLASMLEPGNAVQKNRLRVRFWGELEMLPDEVQALAAKLMVQTRYNTGGTLNVCMAYTSRAEMSRAVANISAAVDKGLLRSDDIDAPLYAEFLDSGITRGGVPLDAAPDVLIRTSAEIRLSDFLLWQSAFAHISFLEVMWPDFSAFHYARVVLAYRRSKRDRERRQRLYERQYCCSDDEAKQKRHSDIRSQLYGLSAQRYSHLEGLAYHAR